MHLTHKFLNKYLFKCPLLALLNASLIFFLFPPHLCQLFTNLQIYIFFFDYFVLTGYTQILHKKKIENCTQTAPKRRRFFPFLLCSKWFRLVFPAKMSIRIPL